MRYTVIIDIPVRTADGIRVDPSQRLKQWLKIGLRGMGIRAVGITQNTNGPQGPGRVAGVERPTHAEEVKP